MSVSQFGFSVFTEQTEAITWKKKQKQPPQLIGRAIRHNNRRLDSDFLSGIRDQRVLPPPLQLDAHCQCSQIPSPSMLQVVGDVLGGEWPGGLVNWAKARWRGGRKHNYSAFFWFWVDNHSFQNQKSKMNRKAKRPTIQFGFGLVRVGFRSKCAHRESVAKYERGKS